MSTQHNSNPDQHPGLHQDRRNSPLRSQRRHTSLAWRLGGVCVAAGDAASLTVGIAA